MGLLYEEHFQSKAVWAAERQDLEAKVGQLREVKEANQAKILEYEQHWDALVAAKDTDDDQSFVRAKMADTARKIGLLKANEAMLTRKYEALQARERLQRAEMAQLRTELVQMENHSLATIGALTRSSEAAAFKAASLCKSLAASVPTADLDAANRQYASLTARYRDLLGQQAAGSTQVRTVQELELVVAAFRREKEMLARELTAAREKVASLEVLISAVGGRKTGGGDEDHTRTTNSSQLEIERLAKQVGRSFEKGK